MKPICRYLPLLLICSVPVARAQGPFNVALGFGSAWDTSNGQYLDANTLNSCTPSSLDTTCERTPGLGGLFMGFDGDALISKHFGFGGELNFQPAKGNYGPLQYRQEFYDFNGLYDPIYNKHFAIRIEGGIGGAHTGFSYYQNQCVGTAVCSGYASPVGGANHFQEHAGVGIEVYLTHHLFVRPQFDYHHVSGFTNQFGMNNVPEASIWVGYSFGSLD
jgi:hypothetical protein